MAKDQPAAFRTLPKDERRERILWAAKSMFVEKGFDAANMDDVAARAGTTKPTVYAHFATKEMLFAAVVEFIRGLYLGKLKEPSAYAADPAEAVARFCARFLELASCQVAVGFQRMALAAAGHSPQSTRAVYDTVYGEACRVLARYLKDRKLCRAADREAHLLLSATTGAAVIGYLYGVEDTHADLPDEDHIGRHIDVAAIHAVVNRLSAGWRLSPT
jgi:AcrR family transcriptional regulator